MMKLALIAAGIAAGLYALTRPTKKKLPDQWRPKKPGPKKVAEPIKPPEEWRQVFEDNLVDAVATCAARELPPDYDQAVVYVKSCTMDLIFPQYAWPPRPKDNLWKKNLWNDEGLHGAVRSALQADVPGP